MYAIIESGGKQYRVQEGDRVRVEKLAGEIGSSVTIDQVLLIGGDKTIVGAPLVEGASVTCKIVEQDKAQKILVFHYKAKKNIRKRYGHRQPFTGLLIEKIVTDGPKKTAAKAQKDSISEQAATAETATAEVAKPVKKTTKTEAAGTKAVTKTSAAKTSTAKTATKAAPAKTGTTTKKTTAKKAEKTEA